jgi:hypothetical protein
MRKSTGRAMKAAREQARREATTEWYPRAHELQLPHVPEHARESVREFLSTFVHKVRVRAGDCWWVAQTFAHYADSPRVRYVEGVWTRGAGNSYFDPKDPNDTVGAPHAWNLVDGYPVCLVAEFYRWRNEDAPCHEHWKEHLRLREKGEVTWIGGVSAAVNQQ